MAAQLHAHRVKISLEVSEEERTYIKMMVARTGIETATQGFSDPFGVKL